MLAIRLPEEIEVRLAALAKATGRTKTFYAREAILRHLDDLEDLYLAEQRLLDVRAGKSATTPLEDVMALIGDDRCMPLTSRTPNAASRAAIAEAEAIVANREREEVRSHEAGTQSGD